MVWKSVIAQSIFLMAWLADVCNLEISFVEWTSVLLGMGWKSVPALHLSVANGECMIIGLYWGTSSVLGRMAFVQISNSVQSASQLANSGRKRHFKTLASKLNVSSDGAPDEDKPT